MSDATVYRFRRSGQCCGLCRHMLPTGDERRWHAYVCAAITKANGEPGSLPVVAESGTHCAYFRARASSRGEGDR